MTQRSTPDFLEVDRGLPRPCRFPLRRDGTVQAGYGRIRGQRANRWAYIDAHGPIPPGMLVCHAIGCGPPCCAIEHLFLCTPDENLGQALWEGACPHGESHPRAKLTDRIVVDILERFAAGEAKSALAREYGVHPGTVDQLVKGWTWRHVPRPDVPVYRDERESR